MRQWTKPFYGISHYGELKDKYWVTVIQHDKYIELVKHYPGCGFSPITETYKTLKKAKQIGEKYFKQNVLK